MKHNTHQSLVFFQLAVCSEPDGHRGKRAGTTCRAPVSGLDVEPSPDLPFCLGDKTKAAPPASQTEGVFRGCLCWQCIVSLFNKQYLQYMNDVLFQRGFSLRCHQSALHAVPYMTYFSTDLKRKKRRRIGRMPMFCKIHFTNPLIF